MEKVKSQKGKGIKLISIICIAMTLAISISCFTGYYYKTISEEKALIAKTNIGDKKYVDLLEENEQEEVIDEESVEFIDDEFEVDLGNKIDDNKPYVYSLEDDGETLTGEIFVFPFININSDEIKVINEEIKLLQENIINGKIKATRAYYFCHIYNNLIDLSLWYGYDDDYSRIGYHIDITKKKTISNTEFLKILNIDNKNFQELINDALLENYNASDYFNDEQIKNFEDFLDKTVIVSKDGKSKEKYVYNFEKIVNTCDIYLVSRDYIYVGGLVTPRIYYSCEENTGLLVCKERKTVLLKEKFSYTVKDYGHDEVINVTNYLPLITINSKDADEVNKELSDIYEKGKKAIEKNGNEIILKAVDSGEILTDEYGTFNLKDEIIVNKDDEQVIDEYYTIDFENAIINNKVVALLVEISNTRYSNLHHGLWEYRVYNFDIETGKLLTNKEFIEKCGLKVEDFNLDDIEKYNITFRNMGNQFNSMGFYGIHSDYINRYDNINTFYVSLKGEEYTDSLWSKVEIKSEN